MSDSRPAIGIIGLGYVGGAVRRWFENQGDRRRLFFYDQGKNIGSPDEVNRADVIFIAVPTPYRKSSGYDDSAVRESLARLIGAKTVVIKSTVLPGTTEALQAAYPQHKIFFNPEFLRASTAFEDFIHPDRQIVGYTAVSKDKANEVMELLPSAPYVRAVSATEAEMVKYFGNTFLASRVIFANQIYDICEKLGADYTTVKECVAEDPRIGGSHFDVMTDGYRGYGGTCFPKDTKALVQLAKSLDVDVRLLEAMEAMNLKLNGDPWCD